MTEPHDLDPGARDALERFHAIYQQDLTAGTLRDDDDYVAMFPAHAALIRRELRVLSGETSRPLPTDDPPGGPPAGRPRAATDLPFERLGPYRLLARLGAGGQGEVFLAHDTHLERDVALKLLHDRSSSGRSRFAREAQSASRLADPAICTVYDAGEIDGHPYIAMRFVAGRPLDALIREAIDGRADLVRLPSPESGRRDPSPSGTGERRRALERLLEFFETCARALHTAHEAGLLHRDVKPGNVMVTDAGRPVLLDFGMARDAEARDTSRSLPAGTPEYMSPEQLDPSRRRSGTGHLDRRTDVYSLAVTLYECLTLTRPFDAPDFDGLYLEIVRGGFRPLRQRRPWLPVDLEVVLHKALSGYADSRYRTAADFADELARVRENRSIVARPVGALGRFSKWCRREPLVASLLGGLLFAAGASASLLVAERRTNAAMLIEKRDKRVTQLARELDAAQNLHRRGAFAAALDRYAELERALDEAPPLIARDELAILSCDAEVGDLRYAAAAARLRALGDLDPLRMRAPFGGLHWLLRAELDTDFATRREDVDAARERFDPADWHYARALTATTVAELRAACDLALAARSDHLRALRMRCLAMTLAGDHDGARLDQRRLEQELGGARALGPMGGLRRAVDPRLGDALPSAENADDEAAADVDPDDVTITDIENAAYAIARAGVEFIDVGIAAKLPYRYSLPPAYGIRLTALVVAAAGAAQQLDRVVQGVTFRWPPACLSTLRAMIPVILGNASRETLDALIESVPEPLALMERARKAADAAAALDDLRRAATARSMFGRGRGLDLYLFHLLARHASTADAATRDELHRVARDVALRFLLHPGVDRDWRDLLARIAADHGLDAIAALARSG